MLFRRGNFQSLDVPRRFFSNDWKFSGPPVSLWREDSKFALSVAEVFGDGRVRGYDRTGLRICERDLRGVQHLSRRVAGGVVGDGARFILLVANERMAGAGHVPADLMGASGFGLQFKKCGALGRAKNLHVRDGFLSINGLADGTEGMGYATADEGDIGFPDVALLEDFDHRVEGGGRFCEQEAAGGVAIKTMHGAEAGVTELGLEARFGAAFAVREHVRGLVDDDVVGVFVEDLDRHLARCSRCGFRHAHFDLVVGFEFVSGHPDALVVDEYGALVEELFGPASGDAGAVAEEFLQCTAVLSAGHFVDS